MTNDTRVLQEIIPIRSFQDGSYAIECAFCEGRGIFPETGVGDDDFIETEPCPVCHGKGINIYKVDQEFLAMCRYCDGNGRGWNAYGYFVGETCPVCQGTGIVLLEVNRVALENEIVWSLIHPDIENVARSRFEASHYADSVEAALKKINATVKEIVRATTGEEMDGAALMQKAFSTQKPIIRLGDLSTETGRNIQQGYMQMFSGAMKGIRNPQAHDNLLIERTQAVHLLFVASLLMKKVDERLPTST